MDDIDKIIRKSLDGTATESEKQLLKQWLQVSNQNQKIYQALSRTWNDQVKSASPGSEDIRTQLWQQIKQQRQKRNLFPGLIYYRIAAVLILLVSFSWIFYRYQSKPLKNLEAIPAMVVKQNPPGQKSKIFLPDGSMVWLNAASTLSYPEFYQDSLRTVSLSGEAYFEVAEDSLHPFVVSTEDFTVSVLGTSFNLQAFPEEHIQRIALVSGSVRLETDSQKEILMPGELASFNKQDQSIALGNFDPIHETGWKEGILIFNGDSFQDMITKLSRWYGLDVQVQGEPSMDWALYARFDNEYLTNVLEQISFNRNFNYRLEKKNLYINFN